MFSLTYLMVVSMALLHYHMHRLPQYVTAVTAMLFCIICWHVMRLLAVRKLILKLVICNRQWQ